MEDKEFVRQMTEAAKSFEAPYEEGAWEDFSREREYKRGILGWRWQFAAAAAALLFLLLGGWWFMLDNSKDQPSQKMAVSPKIHQQAAPLVVQKNKRITATVDSGNLATVTPEHKQQAADLIKNNLTANDYDIPAVLPDAVNKSGKAVEPVLPAITPATRADSSGANLLAHSRPAPPAGNSPFRQNVAGTVPMYDSLAHRNTKPAEQQAAKNFNYAVAVNPAVGNKKLNLGVGLEVAYAVNDRLSIGSGLGFTSLHAQSASTEAVVASRQLQGTDLDVNGLEVPLNLRYQTSGGFYVNAGISAVAVVSDQMAYHYLTQTPEAVTLVNNLGATYQALRTSTTPTTEQSKETLARYIGFYTFSVGKRQAIGKKQINWGPFIKVPFNPVSSQDIHLTQGGFRLSFEF